MTRVSLSAIHAVIVAVASMANGWAQTPATNVKSRSELVSVPVVVIDSSGGHVRDLKKEDFTVLEDGEEQTIAVFEEIDRASASTTNDQHPAGEFNNVSLGNRSPQLTIILLDFLNTPVSDQIHAKDELVKYLADSSGSAPPTSVLALTKSGVKIIHHFTRDSKELMKAVNGVQRSQPPVTEDPSEALLTTATDKLSTVLQSFGEFQVGSEQTLISFDRRRVITLTLDGMRQIAQAYAGFPGRKTLIWASGGFPFVINEANMALREGVAPIDTQANIQPLYEKTWEALNQAQISMYPVDVHGLGELPGPATAPVKKPLPDPFMHGQWLHAETNATFELFAKATAGRAYMNQNGLERAIRSANDDSSSYYVLGYYLRREGKKDGWRKLHVDVHRKGIQVLARTGFFLRGSTGSPDDASPDSMQAALDSPLEYTAIPITARWQETVDAEQGKKKAIFTLTMPAGFAEVDEDDRNRFALDFWACARTPAGKAAGDIQQTMQGHFKPEAFDRFRTNGTDYRGAITVAPGEYVVRFVVRDRLSGRIGTVSAPLKVDR